MIIDEGYRRKVRIQGKPGDISGYNITLTDVETGEAIENAFKVVVTLDVKEWNQAEISYYAEKEGRICCDELGKPIIGKAISLNPEIDVTALERLRKEKGKR